MTYNLTLNKGLTIKSIGLGSETILGAQLHYSYDKVRWIVFDGTLATANNIITFTPPLFTLYLALTLHPARGVTQCAVTTINACLLATSPTVKLSPQPPVVFSDALSLTCMVTGQPYPVVSWRTTSGFIFKSQSITNQFSDKTGNQNSTLLLSKQALAKDGFKCSRNAPPCGTVVCTAKYQGGEVSSTASVNFDVRPSPPGNVSVKTVLPHSATITWVKQAKDAIMDYARFRVVVTSLTGPPIVSYIPVTNQSKQAFSYHLTNLQQCIFYQIELTYNNYYGESVGVKRTFSTPTGVIAVILNVTSFSATAVTASWRTQTLAGSCDILAVSSYRFEYKCLSGLSNLTACSSAQTIEARQSDTNAVVGSLNPSTTYTIKLIAVTSHAGVSITSNSITFTTREAAPVLKPSNVVPNALNSTAVRIQWGPIPSSGRHGLVQHYILAVLNSTDSTSTQNYMLSNTTLSITVADLTKCTEYTVNIKGCTGVGCGPSLNIKFRTLDESTDAFYSTKITLDDSEPNNITMRTYLQGLQAGTCVIGYVMQYRKPSQGMCS